MTNNIQNIIVNMAYTFPEGVIKNLLRNLKNKIKCKYYNYKHGYKIAKYTENCFTFNVRNYDLKFKEDCLAELLISNNGYFSQYYPKKEDIIIDGGAYIGSFSIICAKLVGSKGRVYAYEPDTENSKALKINIELNNLNNVVVIEKGLWHKDEKILFSNEHTVGSSLFFNSNLIKGKNINVTSLDNEANRMNIKYINMIKMDIEGAEVMALLGCKVIMNKNNINFAIASYHLINDEQTSFKLEDYFTKHKYDTSTSFPEHLTTYGHKSDLVEDPNN